MSPVGVAAHRRDASNADVPSGRPGQPGFHREIRHAPELGEVVGDERHVEGQGVRGNPQVVGADRPTDGPQVGTKAAVVPGDVRVEVDDFDRADEGRS